MNPAAVSQTTPRRPKSTPGKPKWPASCATSSSDWPPAPGLGLASLQLHAQIHPGTRRHVHRRLADAANVHPLPNTMFGGRAYMLGNFMSKELTLAELAEFCRAAQRYPKPCVLDEDNTASMYRDTAGWTIHRKRAWVRP